MKKAYVSIVSESICDIAKGADYHVGCNALQLSIKRKGLEMNMVSVVRYFRFFAALGLEAELIDLL